ncbi:unnamed protein product [Thlaspi arvense]|uniref:Uncharacterized protein n=1 Tax=Thlaspi arvense TaxID=13288 RepID=A0AAU9R5K3_THLAR|nr:unnamed protein product [Thlaspi arvense]
MERQFEVASSGKAKLEEKKKEDEKSVDKREYLASKQVSDESVELEKSCLTEEGEDDYLSDQNSRKRTREADTTCESNKRTKLNDPPSKESDPYVTLMSDDDWLFGTVDQQKKAAAIKNDIEDMKLQISSSDSVLVFFPRAQFLPQVEIFALPYTVLF